LAGFRKPEESMNFLARMMKFLFWLLIVSWGVALLRQVLAWMLRRAMPAAHTDQGAGVAVGRRLVRDPVCGMHVAEALAVPLGESGELVHFCSLACRDKHVNGRQRMAANG
jgi:YHS domain-containing protein